MGAGHDHGAASSNRTRLAIAFAITFLVVIAQAIGSILTGSLALLVDTAHMLVDTTGLFLALVAAGLMARPASDRHTWGLRRTEVLSAMLQATILFAAGVFALVEGVRRLLQPPEIASTGLLIFGVIGLTANLLAMAVLFSGRGSNLNMRAAFLEVATDALGSVGVIAAAVLIALFGWHRADTVAAILIASLIIPRTIILLRATLSILLEATPRDIDLEEVRSHILSLPHVLDVHDLHITRISSDLPVLTAHVVVEDACFVDGHTADLLPQLQQCVAEHFTVSIAHSTFQLEPRRNADREHVRH